MTISKGSHLRVRQILNSFVIMARSSALMMYNPQEEYIKMKKNAGIIIIIGISMFLLMGCGSTPVKEDCLDAVPKWVNMGSAAFSSDGGSTFYGVGVSAKSVNHSIMRNIAEAKAAADLTVQLETYIAHQLNDYIANYTGKPIEDDFNMISKQITKQILQEVKVTDTYLNKCSGEMYVLIKVDSVDDIMRKIRRFPAP